MHFSCYYSILTDFVSVGAIAMTGFFMLSGYALRLVYGNQNLMEKHHFVRFYIKRALGVLPLYYVVALLHIVIYRTESLTDLFMLFPIEALGLQSTFTTLFGVSHNGGTWFISCIVLAYLIYPFLQHVCNQLRLNHKVFLLALLMFLDVWGAIVALRFETAGLYTNPFFRLLEFACGMIIADININHDGRLIHNLRSWWALIMATLVLVVGVTACKRYFNFDSYMLYNVVVLPCFAVILFSLGSLRMLKLEKCQVIGYLGKISYAFFLTQFFVWDFGRLVIGLIGYSNKLIKISVTLTFCIIAAILLYELIQKPMNKWVKCKILNK